MKYYDKNATIDWGDLTDVVCGEYEQPTQRPPDFIGIGAQKSATTWLWTQLQKSPSVSMPPVKELHYFDLQLPGGQFPPADASSRLSDSSWIGHARNTLRYIVDLGDKRLTHQLMHYYFSDWNDAWYRKLFGIADPGLITGEITPRYAICDDKAIEHMASVAPEAKLIFCIRNPIDRFWSQCLMKYRFGTLAPGAPAAMAFFNTLNGKPRGHYSETLLRFSKWFDPKQILIVFYDAIARYPQQTLNEIHDFLGIPRHNYQDSCKLLVNNTTNDEDMSSELRARVAASYRHELHCLNDTFGGHTSSWLQTAPPLNIFSEKTSTPPSTLRLKEQHLVAFHSLLRPRRERKRNQFKIFCLSMQRSGTTSTGDWLESHGLVRAGSPTSTRLGWSRSWFDGDLDVIFENEEFKDAEILEDDPWWFPEIYVQLAKRFPESRFILLDREANSWFDSMCRHSGGKNPGWSDIHARIYNREEDLKSIEAGSPVSAQSPNLLPIVHLRKHYTDIYRHHTAEVLKYFSAMPSRLFYGKIDDAKTFPGMLKFLQLKQDSFVEIPHTNKRTAAMETRFQDEVRRLGLS
tara:strand:+ start:3971 stop:5695 length:1725 start_codon:yes stop_codon:yes gene_type:complete